MKTLFRYSFLILSFLINLLSLGCRKDNPTTLILDNAQNVMSEYPDSSLNILNRIEIKDLKTKEHHARYALLYSQALDKNYIDITNDSLIQVAVNYYKDSRDIKSKFHAYYYLGRVYVNANELAKATLAYMEAEQLNDELGDEYSVGLLYKQIGYIYRSYYDFPKSLHAYQQAINSFAKSNRPLHKIQTMLSLSDIYRNMNEGETSYEVLETALAESKELNNQSLIKSCISNLIVVCIDMGKWEEATRWYQEYIKNDSNNESMTIPFKTYIAQLHAKNKNFEEAFRHLNDGWNKALNLQDSINLYHAESQVHLMNASWEEAYRSMEKSITSQNRIIRETLEQPVLTAQKNYLDQELAFKAYKLRMEKTLRIISISFISVIALIIIFLVRRRLHKQYLKQLKEQEFKNELHVKKIQKEAEAREQSIQSIVNLLEKELKESNYLSAQNINKLKTELEATKCHINESLKTQQEMSNYIKELYKQIETLKGELESQTGIAIKLEEENNVHLINNSLKSKLLKRYFTLMEDLINISTHCCPIKI